MNKMFFAFLAAITLLPGCFGLFKKDEPKIEQTSATSAEEIAPISDENKSEMNESEDEESKSEESDSDEK
ncbi:hypothetical protein HYV10_02635 [Candidatus Dependentiae bacterium]|nr:hypothetical protein [Candidatus Dependentiae bacterium]